MFREPPALNHKREDMVANPLDRLLGAVDYGMTGTSTRPLTEQTEYKFGSDNQFDGPQGYRRPQHESHEALSRRGVELVRTLHLERDHSNEGVSSARHSDQSSLNGVHETHNGDIEEENEATPPRKRRKSKAKGEDERNDNESSSGVGILNGLTKKRKPKADLALDTAQASTSAAAPAAGQNTPKKRRKSAITNPIPNGKTPRENLTDAQKRENHIQSEKKRRGAITEGYEGLKWIVPGLIEESSSKSITLQKAGEWVEELKESNRLLKQRLDAMGG
ncbi:hypothetical protein F5Y16DRAFT_376708 [Xylariaceae sp. FL0255]|nr:hypothetical protein F5Y16DRAFT_376708 [Xylariaceae sp. FL0255]